jgi:hypothetical protein
VRPSLTAVFRSTLRTERMPGITVETAGESRGPVPEPAERSRPALQWEAVGCGAGGRRPGRSEGARGTVADLERLR